MDLEHISQFLAESSQTIKSITNRAAMKLQKNGLDLTLRKDKWGTVGYVKNSIRIESQQ